MEGGETGKKEMRRNGREGGRKDDEKGVEVQRRIQRGTITL